MKEYHDDFGAIRLLNEANQTDSLECERIK